MGLTVVPAGASAVIGGERVDAGAVPWFISFPTLGCGGTLVAVDRVIAAAHCVGGFQPADVGRIRVGRQVRRVVHFALAPGWENATHDTYFPDDVAIVGLNAPVTRVRPVPLDGPGRAAPATRSPARARPDRRTPATVAMSRANSVRRGWPASATAPARGSGAGIRATPEHFNAARMLCAIDADGRPPLSSGYNGDTAAPVLRDRPPAAAARRDQLGGQPLRRRSPAERLRRGRPLPHASCSRRKPVWEPRPTGPSRISGDTRAGGALTCTPPTYNAPVDALTSEWLDRDFAVLATGPSYTVEARDAGRPSPAG